MVVVVRASRAKERIRIGHSRHGRRPVRRRVLRRVVDAAADAVGGTVAATADDGHQLVLGQRRSSTIGPGAVVAGQVIGRGGSRRVHVAHSRGRGRR